MAFNFKQVMNKPERLAPGHRLCAGCGAGITVRTVLRALKPEDHAVIGNATGCLAKRNVSPSLTTEVRCYALAGRP